MSEKIYKIVNGLQFELTGEELAQYHIDLAAGEAAHALWMKTEYQRKRAAEYPSIGDQLDALWKGGTAAADMKAKVDAVKAKYPKPEGM